MVKAALEGPERKPKCTPRLFRPIACSLVLLPPSLNCPADGRTVGNALGPTAGIDAFSDLSDILASLNHAEEADTARLMGERAQIAADAEKAVKPAREAVARVFDLPPTDEMRLGSAWPWKSR
jgi:hypothetical protein